MIIDGRKPLKVRPLSRPIGSIKIDGLRFATENSGQGSVKV